MGSSSRDFQNFFIMGERPVLSTGHAGRKPSPMSPSNFLQDLFSLQSQVQKIQVVGGQHLLCRQNADGRSFSQIGMDVEGKVGLLLKNEVASKYVHLNKMYEKLQLSAELVSTTETCNVFECAFVWNGFVGFILSIFFTFECVCV